MTSGVEDQNSMETVTSDDEMEVMDSAGPSTEQKLCQQMRRQNSPKQGKKRTKVREIRRVETAVSIKQGQALPKYYGPRNTMLHGSKRIPVLVANVAAVISVALPTCLGRVAIHRPDITEQRKAVQELTELLTSYNIMSFKNSIQHKFEHNPWIFEEFMNYTQNGLFKKSNERSEQSSSKATKTSRRKNDDQCKKSPGHDKKQPTKSNCRTKICHLCLQKRNHKIRRQREKHWKRLEMRYDELCKLNNELNKLSAEEKRFDQKKIYFEKDVTAFREKWNTKLVVLIFIRSHRTGNQVAGTWIVQKKDQKHRKDNEISYKCHSKCILREELRSSRKKSREMIQNNNRPTLQIMSHAEVQQIIEDEESKKTTRDENMIEHLMSLLSL